LKLPKEQQPYPNDIIGGWNQTTGRFVSVCMEAHGYGQNMMEERCDALRNFATQAYCYAPLGRVERLIFEIEKRFESR
jgi:hypothetical protein